MTQFTLVGHAALDIMIYESDMDRFNMYTDDMSIDQVEALSQTLTDGKTGRIFKAFGGPALTVGHYLAANYTDVTPREDAGIDVSIVTVIGKGDELSRQYEKKLADLSIDIRDIRKYPAGSLSRCAYVFYDGGKKTKPKKYWEDGVSMEFHRVRPSRHLLKHTDVLVLPITEPDVADAVSGKYLEEKNGSGKLVYNPGPYLTDHDMTTEELHLNDIIGRSTIIAVNADERKAIKERLELGSILHLFDRYPRLETLISTKGRKGSVIFQRKNDRGIYSLRYGGSRVKVKNSVGAGDAFLGTYLLLAEGYRTPPAIAQQMASEAAQECLKLEGAINDRMFGGNTSSRKVTLTEIELDRDEEEEVESTNSSQRELPKVVNGS